MGAKRILVVDDNPDVLRLVDEALSAAGYEVTTSPDGRSAVRDGALSLPDLVLLDIGLPDYDGFTVCARLREKPAALECPIIFLTAAGDIDSRLHGFEREPSTTSSSRSTSRSCWPGSRCICTRARRPRPTYPAP